VYKILFEKSSSGAVRTTFVEYVTECQTHVLEAKKEVLVASSVCQSVKLLKLSGIGDSVLLSKHDIKTIVNRSNAGERLQGRNGTCPGGIYDQAIGPFLRWWHWIALVPSHN
jgi:choline dehydrogenase-like flavoprotein